MDWGRHSKEINPTQALRFAKEHGTKIYSEANLMNKQGRELNGALSIAGGAGG